MKMAGEIVVNYEGGTVKLVINLAEESIGDVKASVVEKSGSFTTEEGLVLVHEGTCLDDSLTLSSYGIEAGTVLRLETTAIEVRLTREGHDIMTVEVGRSDTVGDLKRKISQDYDLSIRSQHIKRSGFILGDATILSSLRNTDSPQHLQLELDIRLNITLEVYTGTTIPLEVSGNEPVDTLHTAVHHRARVPYHHQEIVYNDRVLEIGRRISDYGVPDGATLVVNLRDYEVMVFVKTLAGRTIMLMVTPRDTVAQVKAKIEQQEGIPVSKQRLIFVGDQLHDDHRLLDYRIEHESAVHLVFREGDSFEVYVRGPSGRSYVFEVDPNDSVDQLKSKLKDREGIPPDVQCYFLEDQLLNSDSSLGENGVTSGSTLRLSVDQHRSTQIFISMPSRDTFSLWVNPNHTISRLKEMIAEKKNIAPEVQELRFARRLLEDDKDLRYYTIETNHMIHLSLVRPRMINFTITIEGSQQQPLEFEESANWTVRDIKQALLQRLALPVQWQQVFLEGTELEDARKLGESGITNGCNLDLIVSESGQHGIGVREKRGNGKIHLFVKTLTGKTIIVEVEPTDTVLAVKEQINAKEGVAIAHQCLICGGKMLDNDVTVSDCGMQNQSMLHLVLRVPSQGPVTVVAEAAGKNYDLVITEGDTVYGLKEEIEERTGIPAATQTLLVAGEALDEMEPLSSYNLVEGTKIEVQEK